MISSCSASASRISAGRSLSSRIIMRSGSRKYLLHICILGWSIFCSRKRWSILWMLLVRRSNLSMSLAIAMRLRRGTCSLGKWYFNYKIYPFSLIIPVTRLLKVKKSTGRLSVQRGSTSTINAVTTISSSSKTTPAWWLRGRSLRALLLASITSALSGTCVSPSPASAGSQNATE